MVSLEAVSSSWILREVRRDGARQLLTQALEAEVSEFLAATADLKGGDGCRRVVRHGRLPERDILTGIGRVGCASRACARRRLSATTIERLKDVWIDEHKRWSERDPSAESYV